MEILKNKLKNFEYILPLLEYRNRQKRQEKHLHRPGRLTRMQAEDRTTQIELLHDDAAEKLRAYTLPERSNVVRKGLSYAAKEDRLAHDSVNAEQAARCRTLESENALLRTQMQRAAEAERLRAEAIFRKQFEEQLQCRQQASLAEHQLALQHLAHAKASEIAVLTGQVGALKQNAEQALQQRDAARAEQQKQLERYGQGAASTSGNGAKGDEGEGMLLKVLRDDLPSVMSAFDPTTITNVGKGAGHSADLALQCNGIDVLIEVKTSHNPVRKKEIDKAVRDLQEQESAKLLVIVSWYTRFQGLDEVHEHDLTYLPQANGKVMVFVPNFLAKINKNMQYELATTIASVTAHMRIMGLGANIDCFRALTLLERVKTASEDSIKRAREVEKAAREITRAQQQIVHDLYGELHAVMASKPALLQPHSQPQAYQPPAAAPVALFLAPADFTGAHALTSPPSPPPPPQDPAPPPQDPAPPPADAVALVAAAAALTAPANAVSISLAGVQTRRRNPREIQAALAAIAAEVKLAGQKRTYSELAELLNSRSDTGNKRTNKMWDMNSVRDSLAAQLKTQGMRLNLAKQWEGVVNDGDY
jgi:hypothetical protein